MEIVMRFTLGFIKETLFSLLMLTCIGSLVISCNFSKAKGETGNGETPPTALNVVENAIATAGTLEKWNNIASLSDTK